jgi:cell division protease FtsH
MNEIGLSIDRLVIGLEGKQLLRVKSRQLTAFHEMGHAFAGSLINEEDGIEKLTLVPRGETQGTTWTIPSASQYNSRNIFLNQILVSIGEYTVGAQMDLIELTRTVRFMVLRYAMTRLQELKQEAQLRNLFYLGSDVKEELNNIIDNFTTNFMDITYNEIVAFLRVIRPGGERIVDQLLISEELTGKDLRTIAREYISTLTAMDILYDSRQSSLFDFLTPELKKSTSEAEEE